MQEIDRKPLSEWKVEGIRLTAFFHPSFRAELGNWEKLVGEPPETVESHPKIARFREEGIVAGRKLSFELEPSGKVHWKSAPAEPPPDEDPFRILQQSPEVLGTFLPLMEKWLSAPESPIFRLALGLEIIFPVNDRDAGYRLLNSYLRSVKLDGNVSDFFFQINRPRPSKVAGGVNINRLTRWAVLALASVAMGLDLKQVTTAPAREVAHACRVEFDISTAPTGEPLLERYLIQLYREFVSLAEEIMKEGDVS
jgi:hypothetical protein